MKIPNCALCLMYARSPYVNCAIHPGGLDAGRCPDFRPDPDVEPEVLWAPEGYSWYGEELIPNRPSRYTQEEQLEMLETHPLFTGICPECGREIDSPGINWECPVCGRVGD
jgi:hypothetical protein